MSGMTDPLTALHAEEEDIFKSTFNGAKGTYKISALSPNAEDQIEKIDQPKPLVESPDDDIFSDCQSEPDQVRNAAGGVAKPASAAAAQHQPVSFGQLGRHLDRVQLTEQPGGSQQQQQAPLPDDGQMCYNSGVGGLAHRVNVTVTKNNQDESLAVKGDEHISVSVYDPHKIGEGMSSYIAYRVVTRTNLRCFRRAELSVVRRFSDFIGLHSRLVEKHQPRGRIVPPAPEKSIIGTTRAKMSTSEQSAGATPDSLQCKADFIPLRRAALERFVRRVVSHPVLRQDPDVVEFLETGGDLPRPAASLSSTSVMKLLGKMGDTVNKITYKPEETDAWFIEKTQHIEQMETQLKKLYSIVENLVACRRDLATTTGAFAMSAGLLASSEDAQHLAGALQQLARVEARVEQTVNEQADADHCHLLQLIKEHLALVAAVKAVLSERGKAFQAWQQAATNLQKKREHRSRLELGGRLDRMGSAIEEVSEWEGRLEEGQDAFNSISEVIKVEFEYFQQYRINDFKEMMIKYLEDLMNTQLQLANHWETFLPTLKTIA